MSPRRAPRPCATHGCPTLTTGSHCDEHKRVAQKQADTKTDEERRFYSSARWQKIRARQLRKEPLCRTCFNNARLTAANTADHIIPRRQGGDESDDNLQSQCGPCHQAKRRQERTSAA